MERRVVITENLWLLLGCTPQASKPCSYPSSRLNKKSVDRDKDINGLLVRKILHKSSWRNTPPFTAYSGQDMAAVFATRGRRRPLFMWGTDVRCDSQLTRTN